MLSLLLATLFSWLTLTSGQFCLPSLGSCTCFTSGGLRQIVCNDHNISVVKAAILENQQDLVNVLTIYNNKEEVLPALFVQDLPQLTHLTINFGPLTTITSGAFANATNLERIDLRNNKLTWLSGDMFTGVTSNLARLNLDNNMIHQLFSDLEPIFLLVSNQITLNGNNLECSCQLQWLNNLIISGVNIPTVTGASCIDSNGNTMSLSVTGQNFTECIDICSLGYYSCPPNDTCILTEQNQTYTCLSSLSPSPSPSPLFSLSPSLMSPSLMFSSSLSSLTVSPSLSLMLSPSLSLMLSPSLSLMSPSLTLSPSLSLMLSPSLSSLSLSPSLSLMLSPSPSLMSPSLTLSPSLSLMLSPSLSITLSPSPSAASLFSLSPSPISVSMSPSSLSHLVTTPLVTSSLPSVTPSPLCSNQQCTVEQDCIQFQCGCTKCLCAQPLVHSSNSTCLSSGATPYCSSDETFGLLWPAATFGTTVSLPCCSLTNAHCEVAVRTCLSNGQWTPATGPQCISPGTHNLQSLLTEAMSGDPVQLQSLSETTLSVIQSGSLLPGDISSLSNVILQTADLVNNMTNPQTIQAIIQSVSELLSDSNLETWQQTDSASQSILTLFNAIERLGYALPLQNGSLIIATDNLALVVLAPSGDEKGWNISSNLLRNYTGGESSIHLPASIFESILGDKSLAGCDVRIVVSLWDIDSELLLVNNTEDTSTVAALVHGQCNWDAGESSESSVVMVNSMVISASIYSSNCSLNNTRFREPVRITLYHLNTSLDNPMCSFLDPMDTSGSQWLDEGCQVDTIHSMSDYTVCNCYHLTSFALLVSPTGATNVNQPLSIATKVGLSISITALIATVVLLFSLKIESKLNQVHRQVALALCLSQITFLIGVDRSAVPSPDILCTLIAVLLHYLLLCTFAWQLVEGIHLYLFVVKVFYNTKIVWAYYPLAWGIPVGIVAITLGIDFCDYGSVHYCWITNSRGALWAFNVPVIVVIVINILVLVAVSFVVARASRKKDPNRCTFCSLLQASFILVPTLGLTWILGFFVVGTGLYSTIVEWIFFVCTTLQGISLFIIHCVVNTEVRVAFLRAIGCHQAARKQKSVFELKPSAALSSIANSAEHWRRRVSNGSRRGSLDNPFPAPPNNKETTAYLIAKALYKLEEESMEDSQMFNQSVNENTTSKKTKVTFVDSSVTKGNDDAVGGSDTESSKGDKFMQELLQAEDINVFLNSVVDLETSETESVENKKRILLSSSSTPLVESESSLKESHDDIMQGQAEQQSVETKSNEVSQDQTSSIGGELENECYDVLQQQTTDLVSDYLKELDEMRNRFDLQIMIQERQQSTESNSSQDNHQPIIEDLRDDQSVSSSQSTVSKMELVVHEDSSEDELTVTIVDTSIDTSVIPNIWFDDLPVNQCN